MNTLGVLLIGTVARVTVLAALGAGLAAVFRRRGPAASSAAALAALTGLVAVTALSLSPWPRFWTLDLEAGDRVPGAGAVAEPGRVAPATRPTVARDAAPGIDLTRVGDLARDFLRELQNPTVAPAAPARATSRPDWRWTAWVAAGLLAAWAVGLGRLGLALVAVRGVRRRSRPLNNAELHDEVERLRPVLGLSRGVELRVSDELTAPATVGWRRPALLLPPDWPRWDAPERRAVLAHELAHVRRADYLWCLWAQLCLALHVYHPLAHWLAARLRLDQELLADAWGARLAGGNRPYLQVLARLALRRSEPPSARLAQPFLPSRNAFLRRIEMLRDAKNDPLPAGPLPRLGRWLTTAVLAAVTLAVAGLRGPVGLPAARAQQSDDRKAELQKKLREINEQLRELERQEVAKGAEPGGADDLSHAPADTVLAVVGRPADVLGRPEFRQVAEMLNQQPQGGVLAVGEVEDVDWMTVLAIRSGGGSGQVNAVRIVHTTKPRDWKAFAAKFGATEEARHNGQVYYHHPSGSGQAGFWPDDRTFVGGMEEPVLSMIDARTQDRPVTHAWDAAWARLTTKGQVGMALDPSWLAASMPRDARPGSRGAALGLPTDVIAPLLDKATGYAATLNIDPRLEVDLVATCPSAQDAAAVRETATALITLAKNAVQAQKSQEHGMPADQHRAVLELFTLLEALLADAKASPGPGDGDGVVRFRARTDRDAAGVVRVVLPALVAARGAAVRAQSMNNMKQIALAMHNYHDVNGHFPPAVLLGPDGKTPYSWRVALLPYLDQDSLFKQYDFNQPWDSPHNRTVLEQMPAVYRHPSDTRGGHLTSYFVPVGTETIFPPKGKGTGMAEITDGTSNTLLTFEAKYDVPWTKPADVPVTPMNDRRVPELGGFTPGIFLGGMADGSVRAFSLSVNPIVLKALFSRAGGEVIDYNALEQPGRGGPTPTPTPPATHRR